MNTKSVLNFLGQSGKGVRLCFITTIVCLILSCSDLAFGQPLQHSDHHKAVPLSGAEVIHLLDSMVVERYQQSTGQWSTRWKEEFTYSSDGRLEQMIYGSWMKTEGDRNKYKVNYTYDTAGKLTLADGLLWDTTTSKWLNNYKYENFFDTKGNKIREVNYFWHGEDSTWANDYIYEYVYDDNGYLIQEIYKFWKEDIGDWMNYSKSDYFNDEEGICTQFSRYYWDHIANHWVVSYKYEYTFNDDGNEIQLMVTGWDTTQSQWFTAAKYDYSWDDNENKIQDLSYDWDTITDQWVARQKYDYTYDIHGNRISYMLYQWNNERDEWDYFDRGSNYYSSLDITVNAGNESRGQYIWPNPAADYIAIDLHDDGPVWFEIYDIQGRKVASQRLNRNTRIPVFHLDNGVYLYVIYGRDRISGKLLIRK